MSTDAALVQSSFAHVTEVADAAAMLFTERLFAVAPDTRALMAGDAEERAALMWGLTRLVSHLGDPDAQAPALEAVKAACEARGFTDAHYAKVGEAMIWALSHVLGCRFTPEVKAAWRNAYAELAGRVDSSRAAA